MDALQTYLSQFPLTWWDVVDLLVVAVVIYEGLKLIRGTRAVQMAIGSLLLVLLYFFSRWAPLQTVNWAIRNIIGLRRRGFSNEVIESIHNAYRIIYQSGLNTTEALKKIEDEFEKSPEIDYIVNFIRNSERGIIK